MALYPHILKFEDEPPPPNPYGTAGMRGKRLFWDDHPPPKYLGVTDMGACRGAVCLVLCAVCWMLVAV